MEIDWGDGDTNRQDVTLDGCETLTARHVFTTPALCAVRARFIDLERSRVSDWSPGHPVIVRTWPGTGWVRRYPENDEVCSVVRTTGGDLALTGVASGAVFLTRTDRNGNPLWWQATYPAFKPRSVQPSRGGGYVVVGGYVRSGAVCLLRTDSNGDELWFREYCCGNSTDCSGFGVRATADGGYVVAGGTVALKVDADGDSVWTRAIPARGVELTDEGNYLFGGERDLVWLDPAGTAIRHVWFGRAGEDIVSVRGAGDGTYLVAGSLTVDTCDSASLARVNDAGIVLWQRHFGLAFGQGIDAAPVADGGCWLLGTVKTGGFRRYPLLVRTDPAGVPRWQRILTTDYDARAYSVTGGIDDGCLVAGNDAYRSAALFAADAQGRTGPP